MVVEKWVGCWRSGDVLKWLSRYPYDIPWRYTLTIYPLAISSLIYFFWEPCDITSLIWAWWYALCENLVIYPCDSWYTLAIPWWYGSVDILLLRTLWYILVDIPSLIYPRWYTLVDILLLRTLWYILVDIPSLIYFFWEPCDISSHIPSHYTLSLYPLNIPSHYTLSLYPLTYPLTIPSQYTISLYPLTIPSHYTLSHTLSIYPLNIPSQYTLSLYPLNMYTVQYTLLI